MPLESKTIKERMTELADAIRGFAGSVEKFTLDGIAQYLATRAGDVMTKSIVDTSQTDAVYARPSGITVAAPGGTAKGIPAGVVEVAPYSYDTATDLPLGVLILRPYAFSHVNWCEPGSANGHVTIPPGCCISVSCFNRCDQLISIDLPRGITAIPNRCFYGTGITEFGELCGLISIHSEAFKDSSSLESIHIPDTLLWMDLSALQGTSVKELQLPDSMISLTGSLRDSALESLIFPNKMTHIPEYLFKDSGSLKTVVLHDHVNSIGESAFCGCTKLSNIDIPESVITIGKSAFESCSSITDLSIPYSVETIEESAFSGAGIISLVLNEGLKYIGGLAFMSCPIRGELIIPDSVSSIGNYAFKSTAVTSVVLPSKLESISEGLFSESEELSEVQIPDNVSFIGPHAFSGTAITDLDIATRGLSIGKEAFSRTKLETVFIRTAESSFPVTIGEKAFMDCGDLAYVELSGHILSIAPDAFEGCSNIKINCKFPEGSLPEAPWGASNATINYA